MCQSPFARRVQDLREDITLATENMAKSVGDPVEFWVGGDIGYDNILSSFEDKHRASVIRGTKSDVKSSVIDVVVVAILDLIILMFAYIMRQTSVMYFILFISALVSICLCFVLSHLTTYLCDLFRETRTSISEIGEGLVRDCCKNTVAVGAHGIFLPEFSEEKTLLIHYVGFEHISRITAKWRGSIVDIEFLDLNSNLLKFLLYVSKSKHDVMLEVSKIKNITIDRHLSS